MADLTINYQREMVVDFTMPFLDLGKTVLYHKNGVNGILGVHGK